MKQIYSPHKLAVVLPLFLISLTKLYGQCPGETKFELTSAPCSGAEVTFANLSTQNNSVDEFVWRWDDGTGDNTLSSSQDQSHFFNTPGTYEVTLVKSCGNNKDSLVKEITIVPKPSKPEVSYLPDDPCGSEEVVFEVDNQEPGIIYTWDFGDNEAEEDSAEGASVSHAFTPQGGQQAYQVKVTGESPEGCKSDESDINVNIKESPKISLVDEGDFMETEGNFKRCLSSASSTDSSYTFQFRNSSVSADPNTEYVWDWGDGSEPLVVTGTSSETHTYSSFGVKTLTITGTNPTTGCKTVFEQSIINEKYPSASLLIPNDKINVCENTTVTISNKSENATRYEWSWGGGEVSHTTTKDPVSHTFDLDHEIACELESGQGHEVLVKLTAYNSCFSHYNNSPVIVRPAPSPEFDVSPSNTICKSTIDSEETLSFDLSSCPDRSVYPTQFVINFGDNFNSSASNPNEIIVNPDQPATVEHAFKESGKYPVTLTATNSCGVTTYVDTVYVRDPAVASFTNGDGSKHSDLCSADPLPDFTPDYNCVPFRLNLVNTSLNLEREDHVKWTVTAVEGEGSPKFGSSNNSTSIAYEDNLTFREAGRYQITLEVSNSCNEVVSTACAIVNVKDIPDIIGPPESYIGGFEEASEFVEGTGIYEGKWIACGIQEVSGIAVENPDTTITTYNWNVSGLGGTGDPAVPDAGAASPGTVTFVPGEYQIDATVGNECGSAELDSVLVTILDRPAVEAGGEVPAMGSSECPASAGVEGTGTMEELVVCSGETLIIGTDTADTDLSYIWTTDSDAAPAGPEAPETTIVPVNTGTEATCGKYYLEADNGACTNIDSVLVVVKPAPLIDIGKSEEPGSSYDTLVCINVSDFTLPASPSGGTWSSAAGGTFISSSGEFNITAAGTGNHTVTYSYTEPGPDGCTIEKDKRIFVADTSDIALSLEGEYCESDILFDLNDFVTPVGGEWRSDISGALTTAGELTTEVIGSGNSAEIIYNYENSNGCITEDTVMIAVNDPDDVDAGQPDSLCQNEPAQQLTGVTPPGGVWKGTDGTESAITESGLFDPSGLTPGDYKVLYLINEGTPCVVESEKEVVVKALTPLDPGGPYGPFCEDDEPQPLHALPAGGEWSGPGVMINAADTLFDPSDAGEDPAHTLTYTYTNDLECTSTENIDITVQPLPPVDAGPDQTICINPAPYALDGYSPVNGGTATWTMHNTSSNSINNAGEYNPAVEAVDTLIYNFSLPSGCFDEDTMVVTVVPPVEADAGIDDSICADKGLYAFSPGAGSAFDVSMGSRWAGPGVVPGTNEMNTDLLTDAEYNQYLPYTYYYGGGNCVTTDTVEIKVFAMPEITAPVVPGPALCEDEGGSILQGYSAFTPGQSTFDSTYGKWTGPGISQISGTNKYKFDPEAAGAQSAGIDLVYTYTDEQTAGCKSVYTHSLQIAAVPDPAMDLPALHCKDTELIVENQSAIAFGSIATNDWDFGDGSAGAVQTGIAHGDGSYTYAAADEYTVTLRVISAAGCDSSVTGTVKVIEPPQAHFDLSDKEGCGPLPVSVSDNSTGYDSVYSWNFGNGITSDSYLENDTTINYAQGFYTDTLYYVNLEVSNYCGTDLHADSVRVLPKPVADFGTDKSVGCSPAPFNFNNTSAGIIDGMPTWYTWDFGDGSAQYGPVTYENVNGTLTEPVPPTKNFEYTGFNDTTYVIKMTAVNQCGEDSAFTSVKVLPNDVKAFFNQDVNNGCTPLEVQLTDLSSNSTVVSWDFGDETSAVVRDTSHIFYNDTDAEKTFTIHQYANNGCSYDTTKQTITVFPKPEAEFSIDESSVCTNEEVTMQNLSQGINNSTWNFGDGSPAVNNINSSVSHTYTSAGSFPLSLIVKENIHGCPDTAETTVTVNPLPDVVISSSLSEGCQPLEVIFNSNVSTGAEIYEWSFDGEEFSDVPAPVHTFYGDGVYSINLAATSHAGCVDSAGFTVEVFETPDADFSFTKSNPCQYPVQVNLANKSSAIASVFNWYQDGDLISSAQHPNTFVNAPGMEMIKLVASSSQNCKDSVEKPVEFHPLPQADFVLADSTGCHPFTADFINLSADASNYVWDFGDGESNENAEGHVPHVYDQGTYSVSLTAISPDGCTDKTTKNNVLTVDPAPLADFSYVASEDEGSYGVVEFFNTSTDAVFYEWDLGDSTNLQTGTDSLSFSHTYDFYGERNVVLIATNAFGCSDTTTRTIEVPFFGNLFVPNAFTPDFGPDDVREFKPVGMGLETYHCQVFDTWGNLIWESDKIDENTMPAEGWDGTYQGKPLPQNSYVWKIEATFVGGRKWTGYSVTGGPAKTKGTVTLLR